MVLSGTCFAQGRKRVRYIFAHHSKTCEQTDAKQTPFMHKADFTLALDRLGGNRMICVTHQLKRKMVKAHVEYSVKIVNQVSTTSREVRGLKPEVSRENRERKTLCLARAHLTASCAYTRECDRHFFVQIGTALGFAAFPLTKSEVASLNICHTISCTNFVSHSTSAVA